MVPRHVAGASSHVRITRVDIDAYLARLDVAGPVPPNLENLERLQRAHLTAVPFENLDVFARRGVRTDDEWTVSKVVTAHRGGWCFELNGAFAALLEELGYVVIRHAATVSFASTTSIPTHLTLRVILDRPYLVDVGFGDSFMRPLPLDDEGPHDGGTGRFGFVFEEDFTSLVAFDDDGSREAQYRFDSTAKSPTEFETASQLLQTEPGLQWTRSRFATRLLAGGPDRVTLLEDRLRQRRNGTWTEQPINPDDWARLLWKWFRLTP